MIVAFLLHLSQIWNLLKESGPGGIRLNPLELYVLYQICMWFILSIMLLFLQQIPIGYAGTGLALDSMGRKLSVVCLLLVFDLPQSLTSMQLRFYFHLENPVVFSF